MLVVTVTSANRLPWTEAFRDIKQLEQHKERLLNARDDPRIEIADWRPDAALQRGVPYDSKRDPLCGWRLHGTFEWR